MAKTTKQYRISVLIRDRFTDISGFLDMLRYDQSKIESWTRDGDLFEVTLVREHNPHTVDRWRSFGINVAELLTRSW